MGLTHICFGHVHLNSGWDADYVGERYGGGGCGGGVWEGGESIY